MKHRFFYSYEPKPAVSIIDMARITFWRYGLLFVAYMALFG